MVAVVVVGDQGPLTPGTAARGAQQGPAHPRGAAWPPWHWPCSPSSAAVAQPRQARAAWSRAGAGGGRPVTPLGPSQMTGRA